MSATAFLLWMLSWSRGRMSSNSEEDVIQPCHENLRKLSIERYGGSAFPSWMKLLVNLVEIRLLYCSKCEDLPPLGHLPLLKRLVIWGMDYLKRVNKEFYGGGGSFPSLEYLDLGWMPNLEEWESLDQQPVFPSLKKLSLWDCPNLVSLPFSIRHSVQKLGLGGNCEKVMATSLPCVPVLQLDYFTSFDSLQNLDTLESLKLSSCDFASIPQQMENLSSLKVLEIESCSFLTSLSQSLQHLSSLETLTILDCKELEFSSADFHHLLSLEILNLLKLPKLISLPDLQHLPSLRILNIQRCLHLKVLMPQGIQNLTSLRTLTIKGCDPDLESKCKKGQGEYWPYISHIQYLNIRSSYGGSGYTVYGGMVDALAWFQDGQNIVCRY